MGILKIRDPSFARLLCRIGRCPLCLLGQDGTTLVLCGREAALVEQAEVLYVWRLARPSRPDRSRLDEPVCRHHIARLPVCTIFDDRRRPSNHLGKSDSTACLLGTGALLAYPDVFEALSRLYGCTPSVDRLTELQ